MFRLHKALIACLVSSAALGQQCSTGAIGNNALATPGMGCTTVATTAGNEVYQAGLTGAMSSQTICDTTTTPGSSTYCPAGFLRIDTSVEVANAGTLVSAAALFLTFTSDVRTYTNQAMGGSISLVTPVITYSSFAFYHASGTAVTLNSTVASLTGSPTYNVRARTLLIGTQ